MKGVVLFAKAVTLLVVLGSAVIAVVLALVVLRLFFWRRRLGEFKFLEDELSDKP